MAQYNKSLGRFHLDGIAPARRGVPQIEVTFDIDANGIVNVSAKDLGTGKEQHITITSSTNMSKEDIDKAVKEAEMYAAEDAKRKEGIDTRNQGDRMVYQTEKTLNKMGDKLDPADKSEVKGKRTPLKSALTGTDADIKSDTVAKFLPVYDNLVRALAQSTEDRAYRRGVEMIMAQFNTTLEKLGATRIESLGQKFDPNLHNAVMHVEDEEKGENEIVEVFQEGFMMGEKVIRYAMVKVAN